MNKLSVIILSTLGFVLIGAFVGWRVSAAAHTVAPVEGLVFDPSASHMGPKVRACGQLIDLTAALLALAPSPATKLAIMEIGNSHTGGEPILLTTSDSVPARRTLASGIGRLKKDRASYLSLVGKACADTPAPEYSPIYAAVGRMLEHVQTYKCGTAAACTVWVSTDGIENVLTPLRDQLTGGSGKAKQIPKLANESIDVHFCGLAESSVPVSNGWNHHRAFHSKPDPARVESVWKSAFTHPDRVTFAPFCPQTPLGFQISAKE